jgi:hypothetical protein
MKLNLAVCLRKNSNGILWRRLKISRASRRQIDRLRLADLPFLTILSISSQLRWLCSTLPSLAANSLLYLS